MTDETAMGEHDEDIAGEVRDNVQYALVALQDPSAWVHDVGASLQRNALQDDRLFATEDMKRSFAAKLDELIDRDATRIRDATGAFLANHAGVNTFVK